MFKSNIFQLFNSFRISFLIDLPIGNRIIKRNQNTSGSERHLRTRHYKLFEGKNEHSAESGPHFCHPRCKAGVNSSLSSPKNSPSGCSFKYKSSKQ